MFENAAARCLAGLEAYPAEPASLDDHELQAGFADLQAIRCAVDARRLAYLAELDRRRSHRGDGYLSSATWLADRYGESHGAAKGEVKVATALREMPKVHDAFSRGQVSRSAVHGLADAKAAHPAAFAATEEALVGAAVSQPADAFRHVLAEWFEGVESAASERRTERLRQRRRLDVCPTASGMVRIDGELDPESGEAVLTALGAVVDAELRAAGPGDMRGAAQRRADALAELARRYLDSSDRPAVAGERPHLTVTVDVGTLGTGDGLAELDRSGAVDAEVARRLSCDASVIRVVMAGGSEPLDVGRRTPVVPASLRRAVLTRDRSCRFPGCDRPHAWCDAHHVTHWADGGTTALPNLLLLCRAHHRLVHEGGFGLQMVGGRAVFRRPDGSVLEERRPPPARGSSSAFHPAEAGSTIDRTPRPDVLGGALPVRHAGSGSSTSSATMAGP